MDLSLLGSFGLIVSGQTDRANLENKRKARDLEEQILVFNKRIERLTNPLIQVNLVVPDVTILVTC